MKKFLLVLLSLCGGVAFGAVPSVELTASATNLVVSEETTVRIVVRLAPLAGELAQYQPFLNQRPPHLEATFLEDNWQSGPLARPDRAQPPFLKLDGRSRGSSAFTLNKYVSDAFSAFARDPFGGRDPFASFFGDDDFFGRMGPQPAKFPMQLAREKIDDTNAWVFAVEALPLRAVKAGRITLVPVTVKVQVIEGLKLGRDRFGRSVRTPSLKEITVRSEPLTLDVAEPPSAGRPASYCGAIGRDFTVRATLDTAVCTAGDPLVLTLDVAGAQDLASIHPPSFAETLAKGGVFRIDESSLKTETLAQSRRFTWRVRAVKAGTVEFPSLAVAYFDSAKRVYVEKHTSAIPIQVKAGVQAALGAVGESAADAAASAAFPMPDGIDLDLRGATTLPLLPHLALALALFLVPPFLYTLIRLAPPVRRRMRARAIAHRRATAFAKCRRALRHADGARRAQAARDFLATRYDVNAAAVTAADARRLMANDFTEAEILLVTEALADFDRTNFSAKKTVVSLLVVFLGLVACAASPEFSYRRANALATQAADETGFRKAADAYADCVNAGAQNPVLFTNLASCRLLAGDPRAALVAYAQAERWGGETASTQRGIRAARARILDDPRAELPLVRIFASPHFRYSLDVRLVFTAIAWALVWLVLLLPPGALRRFLLTVCACACLAGTVSVAISGIETATAESTLSTGTASTEGSVTHAAH